MGKAIVRARVRGTSLWGESLEGNARFPDDDQQRWASDYTKLSSTWGRGPEWYHEEHVAEFMAVSKGEITGDWVRSFYDDTYGTDGLCYLWRYPGTSGTTCGEGLVISHMLTSKIFELVEIVSITPISG